MRALLVLALLVLLAPPATAHVQAFSYAQTFNTGPYSVFFDVAPAPAYEARPFNWSVYVGEGAAQAPASGIRVEIRVTDGPANVGALYVLEPSIRSQGYWVGPGKLDEAGEYRFDVAVKRGDATSVGNTTMRVYRDLGATIEPENPAVDVVAGSNQQIGFVTKDAKGKLVNAFPDLRIRVEHWDDAHAVLKSAENLTLAHPSAGKHTLTYHFPNIGMYHILFASVAGGFTFDETPLLHLTATRAVNFDEPENEAPLPAVALALGAVALAGLLRRKA